MVYYFYLFSLFFGLKNLPSMMILWYNYYDYINMIEQGHYDYDHGYPLIKCVGLDTGSLSDYCSVHLESLES